MRYSIDLPTVQTLRTLLVVTVLTLFSVSLHAEEEVVPAPLDPAPLAVPVPVAPPPPPPVAPPAPPPAPVSSAVDISEQVAAERPLAPRFRSDAEEAPWRLALGGMVAGIGTKEIVNGGGIEGKQTARGAAVSLGYDITRMVGFTAFVGGVSADSLDNLRILVGGDVQFLPFRLPINGTDVLEFGMLGGASNLLSAASDRIGWHVGARVNINLARTLGFTTVARVNSGYWMLEGGVTARL